MKALSALGAILAFPSFLFSAEIQQGERAGYLFGPAEKLPEEFNGGFSLYAAAWPLVETYPGHMFQYRFADQPAMLNAKLHDETVRHKDDPPLPYMLLRQLCMGDAPPEVFLN